MINIANEMKVIIDFVDSYFLAQLNVSLTTVNILFRLFCGEIVVETSFLDAGAILILAV